MCEALHTHAHMYRNAKWKLWVDTQQIIDRTSFWRQECDRKLG